MTPANDKDLPIMFSPYGHLIAFECIMTNDFFHGARVFMLAHDEQEAKYMFQKQHGRNNMVYLKRLQQC